ncbi:MAG: ABC transporter ATP-binding protein/permease, partial [Actinomycetia bacterium]|nr:ABC transporter ATP-binding protein/permease [Actinomycetes bacterium]
ARIADSPTPQEIPPRAALTTTGVSYAYTDKPLLSDVVLHLEPGEHLIVVGDIGSGKTTLLELLKRNFDPKAGGVYLGGVPLSEIRLQSLRRHTKYVGQDTTILPGTIADNISYGKPEATRAEVAAAARMVLADTWIESLPAGYDTRPSDMVNEPSRSQAAQIQLARALITAPKLLLVDGSFHLSSEVNVALIARRVTETFPDLSVILVGEWEELAEFPAKVLLLRGSESRMLADTPGQDPK